MTDATKRWLDEDEQETYADYEDERDIEVFGNLMDIIDRLCADLDKQHCANPDATTCAKQWEADHQRAALEQHGLADEFPYGCDAIEHVAAALVDARARLDKQREVIGKLPKTADGVRVVPQEDTVWKWHSERGWVECEIETSPPQDAQHDYVLVHSLTGNGVSSCYSTKEAAAAARAGEGRG